MKRLTWSAGLICALLPTVSMACDFASTPGAELARQQALQMVRTSLLAALSSKSIVIDARNLQIQGTGRCYEVSGDTVYEVMIEAQVTTARGNRLVLDPLLFDSSGASTYTRYDNEGVAIGKGYSIDFELEGYDDGGWGGPTAPVLKNAATGVDVISDMRTVPGFQSSLHLEGAL